MTQASRQAEVQQLEAQVIDTVKVGNTLAMTNLAFIIESSLGGSGGQREAARWYPAAAEAGEPRGMSNLGMMYRSGRGVPRDLGEAVHWLRAGAEAGDFWGMYQLGRAYEDGLGVSRDMGEAVRWYRAAAEAGYVPLMVRLGLIYSRGRGVPQDNREAARWYRAAAEAGDAKGMNNLGVLYKEGRGVRQSDAEAARWWRAAAEAGHATGMASLGFMYEQGRGVRQDDAQDVHWWRATADCGNALAMHSHGIMYMQGRAVRSYPAAAAEWFLRSAAAGADEALLQALGALANDVVREMQRILRDEGHYIARIDGIAGPATAVALRAYARPERMENRMKAFPCLGSITLLILALSVPTAAFAQSIQERRAQADAAIERHAIEQYLQRQNRAEGEQAVAEAVERILRESGVRESRALEIVTRAVLDEVPGGEMAQAIYDGEIGSFSDTVAGQTADAITRLAEDSDSDTGILLAEALGGDLQVASDPRAAMEALSLQIIENTPVISTLATIWSTGRDVIDDTIDVWRDETVQTAFEEYRDGSDWEDVMLQMPGLEWRLRSEAAAVYAERHGIGTREIPFETRRALIEESLSRLRRGFDERIEREQVLPDIEASTREVIAHIGRAIGGDPDLLIRANHRNPLYREGVEDSVDFMLGRVFDALAEVERIAGQSAVTDQTAIDRAPLDGGIGRLSSLAAAQAVRAWLEAPADQKDSAAHDALAQHGVLAPAPPAEAVPGDEPENGPMSDEDLIRMFEGIADAVDDALPSVGDNFDALEGYETID